MHDLRVAMVHGRADPARDGVADYTVHLTDALRRAGVAVHEVAVDPGPGGLRRAARDVRAGGAGIVHLQFAPSAYGFSAWPGLLADAIGRRRLVTTVHEYGWWSWAPPVPHRLWRPAERRGWIDRETGRLVPRSDAVVATNGAHAATVRERLGLRAHEVPLAPNVPVHPHPRARASVRTAWGVAPDAEVVVFFGFVHPVKGLRYLVDAVAALVGEHPRLHLLVVGGFTSLALPPGEADDFRAELAARVERAGLTDRVTLTGHRPAREVSEALAAADVAAFPFTAGATLKSGALLAALDHGLPTVVTRPRDAERDPDLVDGGAVVVADRVRDMDALVVALRRVLDDGALATRIARAGRDLTAHRTWQEAARRHVELYRAVTRGAAAR